MKILVTGTAGFIGYHLCLKLLNDGYEVIGLDNINDYYSVDLKLMRLSELGIDKGHIKENKILRSNKFKNFSFIKMDIVNLNNLDSLFKNEKFSHVVNLAAQAGVRYSLENPHTYIQSNVVGFVNILECCRSIKVEHLLYASSSSVYGSNTKIPFSEEDRVDSPVSLYAATKRSNELMAYTYSHLYDLPTTGLRFFTVYGPWGRPDMAPMLFAEAITKGEAIKIFNNGEMQRDFTFINDIIEGIVTSLMLLPRKSPRADIFNIGNSKPVKLMEFISIMENCLNKKAIKNYLPMQDGDVKMTYADTSSIQQEKGYKSKTELKEGINSFVEWFVNFKSLGV